MMSSDRSEKPEPRSEPASRGKDRPNPLALLGLGLEVGAVLAVMTVIGWYLDQRFATLPWLTLTGVTMGMIGGMYNLWRVAKRFVQPPNH